MVWVAHAHEYQEGAQGKNQWAHATSHWRDVQVVAYEGIPPDVPLVLAAPPNGYNVSGTLALPEFEHPEDACYVFGADHRHFDLEMLPRAPDHYVFIPVPGYPELYSWVACAVVLYDRMVKRG